jgi:hypothetical protein
MLGCCALLRKDYRLQYFAGIARHPACIATVRRSSQPRQCSQAWRPRLTAPMTQQADQRVTARGPAGPGGEGVRPPRRSRSTPWRSRCHCGCWPPRSGQRPRSGRSPEPEGRSRRWPSGARRPAPAPGRERLNPSGPVSVSRTVTSWRRRRNSSATPRRSGRDSASRFPRSPAPVPPKPSRPPPASPAPGIGGDFTEPHFSSNRATLCLRMAGPSQRTEQWQALPFLGVLGPPISPHGS